MVFDFSSQVDVVQDQPCEARVAYIDGYRHLDGGFPDVREGGIHDGNRTRDLPVPIVVESEADLSIVYRNALPHPAPVPYDLDRGIAAVEGQPGGAELLATTVYRHG